MLNKCQQFKIANKMQCERLPGNAQVSYLQYFRVNRARHQKKYVVRIPDGMLPYCITPI